MQGLRSVRGGRVVLGLAVGLLLVLTGCVGDGDSDSEADLAIATPLGGDALPLERFHYVAALTLREEVAGGVASEIVVSTEGDVQAPDRHAFSYSIRRDDSVLKRSVVIIGAQAWFRRADGVWTETSPDDPRVAELPSAAVSGVRPTFLGGPTFLSVRESVRRLPSTRETVNGVAASHYRVESAGQEYFEYFPTDDQLLQRVQDLRWELWLAEDGGWPVRLLLSGTITADLPILDELDLQPPTLWELRVDVSRPNDPSLAVVAPEGED